MIEIKGDPNTHAFEIPQNCLMDGKFHFWCGKRLNLVNLNIHINYLNKIMKSNTLANFPSQQIELQTIFTVS